MKNLNLLKKVATVAAASAVAVMATTGKASAITIDFSGGFGTFSPTDPATGSLPVLSGTESGVTWTATAHDGSSTENTAIFRNNDGLGVITGLTGNDNTEIDGDGLGLGETLNITFNPAVKLNTATFTLVDSDPDGDEYSILIDGNPLQSGSLFTLGTGEVTVNISDSPFGLVYSFTVTDGDDDFFLKAVNVEVPEPITMAGLALGSGFGVLLRRKYKKSASFSNQLSS